MYTLYFLQSVKPNTNKLHDEGYLRICVKYPIRSHLNCTAENM